MNMLTDWIKRNPVIVKLHRVTIYYRSFSIVRLIECVAMLAMVSAACASPASSSPGQETPHPDEAHTISQVDNGSISIDGELADWQGRKWLSVNDPLSPAPMTPSPDLDVKVAFAFDTQKFYLALDVLDDSVEKVERSFQFGDGFYFILVNEEGKNSSSYLYQFAFDQEGVFLHTRNSEIFPPFDTEAIEYKFRQHSSGIDYEVAIPFRLLKPFNPFIYKQAALNLVYTDRDRGSVTRVKLFPSHVEDEMITVRRGQFFAFKTTAPETTQESSSHASLMKNFFKDGETIELRYAVNAYKSQKKMKIKVALLNENAVIQLDETNMKLRRGQNAGTLTLEIGDLPSGNYTLRVVFMDQNENPLSEFADEIFILNQGEVDEYRQRISAYKAQPGLEASLSNLVMRFEWLDVFYQKPYYEDITSLNEWVGDIHFLGSKLEKGEPAVFDNNTIKRYAHRSKIDDTLQPYSVFLPESFNANTQYPLIVFLHGSGNDERQLMPGLVRVFGALEFPIIAPKARGLSSEYAGNSGKDVFECIEHFISLYPNIRRDRIFLMGFSMGGTGTWRLGILKPVYFRGLVIISGDVKPDILDQIEGLRNQNIFIIHGAKDLNVPIWGTRQAVEQLKSMQANVVYIELPEAGHGGDLESILEIIPWIKKYSD